MICSYVSSYVNLVGGSRGEKRPEFGGPFDIEQVVKNNILLDISFEQMETRNGES